MKVSEFSNVVAGDDLARSNLFSIEVYPPANLNVLGPFYNAGELGGAIENLSYKAKQVSIPGKSIGTIDNKRFGPIFKVANDLIVDTVAMTFMCSEDYKEHRFFDGWVSAIMGTVGEQPKPRQLYTVSYYDDYVSKVRIIPLDRRGGAVATVELIEAYPSALGPIEYTWGDGQVAEFTVTWTFRDWHHLTPDGWWADSDTTGDGRFETFDPEVLDKVMGDNNNYGGPAK